MSRSQCILLSSRENETPDTRLTKGFQGRREERNMANATCHMYIEWGIS